MLLGNLGIARGVGTVMLLGAGASRGASFATPYRQVLPPLDADFFDQVQRLDEATYAERGREVIDFVRAEYGAATSPTLETLFTQLEAFDRFRADFSIGPGRRTERYRRQLQALRILIPVVFRHAFSDMSCRWHDRIAASLRAGDGVVSFNYDTLIDDALRRQAKGIWDASVGYGIESVDPGGAAEWSAEATPGPLSANYVRLLKLHGSLHWRPRRDQEMLALDDQPYRLRAAADNVIPPTWDKGVLGEWPWRPVWQEANRILREVRCLVVIGYSVPVTDQLSQALIKSAVGATNQPLRLLAVVNPNPSVRSTTINLVRPAIGPRTRIIEFGSLEEFGKELAEAPGERTLAGALRQMTRPIPEERTASQRVLIRRRRERAVRDLLREAGIE